MKPGLVPVSLAALLLASACTSSPPHDSPRQSPGAIVETEAVEVTEVPSSSEAGGIVRAKTTAIIASRITAPVVAVHVAPGDRARKDAPLITLDARESNATRARAAADLAAARESARAAESEMRVAEANLRLARVTNGRVASLFATRSATAQEHDQAEAAQGAAEGQLTAAQARVAAAAAAGDAAAGAMNAADIAASYAVLTAPFDGLVVQRSVDPGSMALAGSPLLTIESPAAFRLEVALDEARVDSIAVGVAADITIDESAEAGWTPTRVVEVARIDPGSHSFLVKLDIPGGLKARSGAFGRARFHAAPRLALSAPVSAIVRHGQLTFVFIVDSDRVARLHPVSIGVPEGERVEVLAGLQRGDTIVVRPAASLADGARVESAPRPTGAAR